MKRRGLSLVEILAVITILVVVAAVFYPVGVTSAHAARRTQCLSNAKHLYQAVSTYALDADDRAPGVTDYKLGRGPVIPTGVGWAGKVFPYIKSTGLFDCPEDASKSVDGYIHPGSSKISYGLNENVVGLPVSGSPKSVLLFEVSRGFARVDQLDEGGPQQGPATVKMSPSGAGIEGDLLETLDRPLDAPHDIDVAYATGRLRNSDFSQLWDDFDGPGRHAGKANYLLMDGHAKVMTPNQVSAGKSASSPSSPESSTGCQQFPGRGPANVPCAAGIDAAPGLTFSAR